MFFSHISFFDFHTAISNAFPNSSDISDINSLFILIIFAIFTFLRQSTIFNKNIFNSSNICLYIIKGVNINEVFDVSSDTYLYIVEKVDIDKVFDIKVVGLLKIFNTKLNCSNNYFF